MKKRFLGKRRVAAVVFATGVVGALTATAVAQSQRYRDVPPDHYAFEAVEWAAEAGVTAGYPDGTFKPERPLSKRHAVVFIERYYDQILQAEESDDFTRGDMMVLLKAINDGTISDSTGTGTGTTSTTDTTSTLPGEGVSVTMARADWRSGYFQAQIYKQMLEELGYDVSEPSKAEFGPQLAYPAMARGDVDFWVNSWYPGHNQWWALELADGSFVGDYLTKVGAVFRGGGLQGLLITKSVADEYGITHLDQLNDDPEIRALFDSDGDGLAEFYGCQESWTCDDMMQSMIAFNGWRHLEQIISGYEAMFAEAVAKVRAGDPMVIFTWAPTAYLAQLRPGDNVYWLAMENVLDDSNPLGLEGGEEFDQRYWAGTTNPVELDVPAEQCPARANADFCQLGWVPADIQVTANTAWLAANPTAAELLRVVRLSVIDVSVANVTIERLANSEADIALLAAMWIAENRTRVDEWIDAARAAA